PRRGRQRPGARRAAQEGRRAVRNDPPSTTVRAELPADPADCPPLDPAFTARLDAALAAADLELSDAVRAGIEAHVRLLLAWTQAINLTAIRTPAGVALEHVADALAALPLLQRLGLREQPDVLDLGSGGGFPGLPLGLALPAGRLVLLDSIGKKARFLRVAAAASSAAVTSAGGDPPVISVIAERAEALADAGRRSPELDLVTVRAVADLSSLAGLGLPLLREGGWLVAWKRDAGDGALATEIGAASATLEALGGRLEEHAAVTVPGLEDHRLMAIRKGPRPAPRQAPRQGSRRQGGA
ncbi:MAG: RsmG family class I SAM-dependent methyltransferase, partial [Candidatus Limnocylindrales bacterium]